MLFQDQPLVRDYVLIVAIKFHRTIMNICFQVIYLSQNTALRPQYNGWRTRTFMILLTLLRESHV